MTCETAGCDEPVWCKGLCKRCYGRWHRLSYGNKCEHCGRAISPHASLCSPCNYKTRKGIIPAQRFVGCIEAGCDEPHYAGRRCRHHYESLYVGKTYEERLVPISARELETQR